MNGLFYLMAKLVAFNASRLYFTTKKKQFQQKKKKLKIKFVYIMEYRNGVICKSAAFDVLLCAQRTQQRK